MDPASYSDDEDCPQLVVGVATKKKIPVTIITGYLGKNSMQKPDSFESFWHLFDISKVFKQSI